MGLQINSSARDLIALQPASFRGNASRAQAELSGSTGRDDADRPTFFGDRERPELRTGFGEGTVSVPAVAARTIDRNMENARAIVPTLEELQEQFRARVERQRELIEGAPEEEDEARAADEPATARVDLLRQRERAEQAARGQARDFINALNEAAGFALARAANEPPPPPTGFNADIRVGDEIIPLQRPRQTPAAQFNLLA